MAKKLSSEHDGDTPAKDLRQAQPSRWLQNIYYGVWSIIGIMLIILVSVAVFGSGTWVENLKITDPSPTAQQQPAPQQPQQPNQDQLDCVAEGVGEDRFAKLQQGDQADADETAIIQECLQG